MKPIVSVVIPAYNEETSVGDIVRRIKGINADYEIVVVDDGSHDKTAAVAAEAGAIVVHHPYNVGNGASVKTGANHASGDVLVFLDADGQHPAEDIPRLLESIGEYDMVIGARNQLSDMPIVRRIGNWGLITIAQFIVKQKIQDLTSGFRAVKREKFMEFAHLYPNRYSYPTTITIAFLMSAYFVKYLQLSACKRRKAGSSNINPFWDGLRFVYIMMRILMLFSPQRLFLPLGTLFLFTGSCLLLFQIIRTGGIQGASVILLTSGIFIFLFGLMAEQIAAIRRQRN